MPVAPQIRFPAGALRSKDLMSSTASGRQRSSYDTRATCERAITCRQVFRDRSRCQGIGRR